ncbi:MAG: ankyrin repeat domain-containing protein [Gemmatimonadota bacterium]|nr:ankyrin repeat domain-containing protein [Gemmatimonadota bacterium]
MRKRPPLNIVGMIVLPLLLGGSTGGPDTPVADAAQRRDLEAVRQLLRQGADVNAAQGDGMTALHWAVRNGDLELGKTIVYAGGDVQAGTRIGRYTPLHMAARSADVGLVILLLEANADPNAKTTNSGATPLHLAAASGDPRVVTELIQGGATVDVRETAWSQTSLMFAAANNRVGAIQALLASGADPSITSNAVNVAEQSDADRAADERLSQFLSEFKEKEGGGTDWQPAPSQVQAAIQAYREIQRKWPDVPSPDDDGKEENEESEDGNEGEVIEPHNETELDPDAKSSDSEPEKVDGDDKKEEEPKPLSYAQLVGSWGGLTALLHAVRQGHTAAALALIEGGADINQPSGGDQTQPLLMATINGQFDLALTLLERGADPNGTSLAGTTPLFAALERQWAPRASYAHPTEHEQQASTHLEVLSALLAAGADPNVRLKTHLWFMEYTFTVLGRAGGANLRGATPFWRAAYALDVDAMRLLMDYGADPNIPTMKPPQRRRRASPAEEKSEVVKAEGGQEAEEQATASVNPKKANAEGESAEPESGEGEEEEDEEEKDYSGIPPTPVNGPAVYPIHAASGVGYGQSFAANAHRHVPDNWLVTVKFLIEEAGAEVDVRDVNAYTALHHAASRGDDELIMYLVERGADVTVLSRKGQTTADMANGPQQRIPPYLETVALLEKLGSKNNHECVSC